MKITINNIDIEVNSSITVLEACSLIGIDIPRFCYHQELSVAGNCRMCLVEIEKSPKPVAACAMPISPNMKIFTDTPLVKKAREGVLEFLLLNHPLDCPICDQAGECDLQDQTFNYGSDRSRFYESRRSVEDKNCGPLIKTIMTRCIHCTRCVRFSTEIGGNSILGTTNRGQQTEIGTFIEKFVQTELSGNLIDLCPVGALTSKPYAFKGRPWELKSLESIDIFDSMLTPIRLDSKDGEIIRVLPQFKNNQEWITDKSRFFYDGIKLNRLKNPLKKQKNWEEISWESLILDLKNIFKKVSPNNICVVLGNSLDTETLLSAKLFAENYGIKKIIRDSSLKINFDFLTNYNLELETIKNSDCCLLVGTNPRAEVNLINLTLQQLTNKKNLEIFSIGTPFQSTYNENLFKCLGLNINELINLLEGKSSICKKLKNSNNPILIYGSGLEERKDFFEIKNIIQNINKNTKFYSSKQINLLTSTSNQNGNLNLGILPFSPEIVENTILYYFVSPSKEFLDYFELILKNKNNFFKNKYIIFQDPYFPQNKINFPIKKSFLIPGRTFVEKEGTFFNIENKSVKILNKLKTTFNSRDDWQIFQIFLSNNSNQIFSYEKIQLELVKLIPNNNVKQYIFENFLVFKSSKFSKIFFKPIINDFYLTHVITNSSKILNKCSIFYRKLATNYSFLKV